MISLRLPWSLCRRRVVLMMLSACCALALVLFWKDVGQAQLNIRTRIEQADTRPLSKPDDPRKLRHLLLPATEVSNETCKLLASSMILKYPEPIILGLPGKTSTEGMSEIRAKQFQERIFKLAVVLEYLESLPESADQDLVLVLDAFDTWLLLPPQVVELRYRRVLQESDARLAARGLLGLDSAGQVIGSKIVLGADQSCYPDETRPYCFLAPDSPLRSPRATGRPKAGSAAHAKWANTGMFLGQVGDLKRMLRSSLDLSAFGYRESYEWRFEDQGTVSDVWGAQERQRSVLAGENTALTVEDDQHVSEYLSSKGDSVEHGITIDYGGQIVQQAWSSMHAIVWTNWGTVKDQLLDPTSDFDDCESPFGQDMQQTWDETRVGVNFATNHTFPIFHMTAHKGLRQQLWPKMWYRKHGKEILARRSAQAVLWSREKSNVQRKSWEDLCSQFDLFPEKQAF